MRRPRQAQIASAGALVALCCAAGCRRELAQAGGSRAPASTSGGELERGLLELSAAAGRRFGLQLADATATTRALDALARRTRDRLAGGRGGDEERIAALNRVFFDEHGFQREVRDRSLTLALLPAVVAQRRGSCLGLAGAYLALGERAGVSLAGVLVPGHFFVRHEGREAARDVELLERGRARSREWYVTRYRVPERAGAYLRALRATETLAVFRFQLANEHRLRGEHRAAVDEYRAVLAALPGYAEAHANLGLALQHLGEHAAAEQAYRRAAAIHPGLEGLDRNLAALREARGRALHRPR